MSLMTGKLTSPDVPGGDADAPDDAVVIDNRPSFGPGRYLSIRIAWLVGTLVAVSLLVFAATQALPSDPALAILGRSATPDRVVALREQLVVLC